jgi:hypothetical protein
MGMGGSRGWRRGDNTVCQWRHVAVNILQINYGYSGGHINGRKSPYASCKTKYHETQNPEGLADT